MSLEQRLAALRKAAEGRIPADKQAIMHRATEDLRKSGILDRVLKVGSRAPSFTLASHAGGQIASGDLLAKGPMVVSFFRGSW